MPKRYGYPRQKYHEGFNRAGSDHSVRNDTRNPSGGAGDPFGRRRQQRLWDASAHIHRVQAQVPALAQIAQEENPLA